MAKAQRVRGLDPDRRLRFNARRIIAARLDEVYAYDGVVADPANVRELHDMRIACKRLRYTLEIFAIAFEADLEPAIDEVKALQDVLGDIHDCDVQVPMLEEHLAWLEAREGAAARELVTAAAAADAGSLDEDAYARFAGSLAASNRDAERPGVHALIARRGRERDELYAHFLSEWGRLKRERFRARLEEALGGH